MLEQILDYSRVYLLPVLGYLILMLLLRRFGRGALATKVKIPLHLVLLLGTATLIYQLTGADRTATAAKVLYLLLLFNIFYLFLHLAETLFLDKLLRNRKVRIPLFFRDIVRFLLLIFGVTLLLKIVFGIEPSTLVLTSTVLSAIIGLSLQDVLGNIFAGASLQIEEPFAVGDWVNINDKEGRILHMSWRSTTIQTRDNDVMIIPNAAVAKQMIINYNKPDRNHRLRLQVGTSYDDPPERVKQSLLNVLGDCIGVLPQPKPEVFVTTYNDFSVDYEIRLWIQDYELLQVIADRVMSKIWYRFKRDGITIPFPIRNLTMERMEDKNSAEDHAREQRYNELEATMKGIDILQPFSEKHGELARQASCRLYGPGERLVRQDDDDCSFFIILSGEVEVLTRTNQEISRVGVFGPGYFFGEIALLTGEKRTASVVATRETEALIISKRSFAHLLEEHPATAVALSEILAQRASELKMAQDANPTVDSVAQTKVTKTKFLARIHNFFNIL